MTLHFDLGKDLHDLLVGSDDERRAHNPHELPPIKRLLLPDSVRLAERPVSIRQERERKLVLTFELAMHFRRILAHAEHGYAHLFQACKRVSEVAGFLRAAWRQVLGI